MAAKSTPPPSMPTTTAPSVPRSAQGAAFPPSRAERFAEAQAWALKTYAATFAKLAE